MTVNKAQGEFRSITRRLYKVVSAPSSERHWDSIRELYHPRATMVRTGLNEEGQPFVLAMTFDEYVSNATTQLENIEFSETEIRQEVTAFGNIAHLASVYEYKYHSPDTTRHGRGINFFNLVNEGQGWKIMNVVWDNEREGTSLSDAGLLDSCQD